MATVAESGGTSPCSSTDIKCLCDNPTYVSETTTCIENTCKGSDLGDAISIGISVCLAAVSLILSLFLLTLELEVTHVRLFCRAPLALALSLPRRRLALALLLPWRRTLPAVQPLPPFPA